MQCCCAALRKTLARCIGRSEHRSKTYLRVSDLLHQQSLIRGDCLFPSDFLSYPFHLQHFSFFPFPQLPLSFSQFILYPNSEITEDVSTYVSYRFPNMKDKSFSFWNPETQTRNQKKFLAVHMDCEYVKLVYLFASTFHLIIISPCSF